MTKIDTYHFNLLKEILRQEPEDGVKLILHSRKIIRLWISAGLVYPNEFLDYMVGIESQTDHVLQYDHNDPKNSQIFNEELLEIGSIFEDLYRSYEESRKAILSYIDTLNH